MFTARYGLGLYIKLTHLVFKRLILEFKEQMTNWFVIFMKIACCLLLNCPLLGEFATNNANFRLSSSSCVFVYVCVCVSARNNYERAERFFINLRIELLDRNVYVISYFLLSRIRRMATTYSWRSAGQAECLPKRKFFARNLCIETWVDLIRNLRKEK